VKLPSNTIIATDKFTRYLLVPQARGDKSAFLAGAGYTLENVINCCTTCARKSCR